MIKALSVLCVGIATVLTSAAAVAQTPAEMADAGIGGATNTPCGDSGECKVALAQCESLLKESQAGAQAALDATRECRKLLNPVVPKPKPAPPAPPACSGEAAVLVGNKCECHVVVDHKATDAINPRLFPVHQAGATNVVKCANGDDLAEQVAALLSRLNDIDKNVPGWNTTRDNVNILLTQINVPNQDPRIVASRFNEMWDWYQGEARRQQAITIFLNDPNGLHSLYAMRSTYCKEIPGKPNATWEEKCTYTLEQLKDTKVEFRFGPRVGFMSAPGAGMGLLVTGNVELEFRVTDKTSIVVGGYMGGVNNRATGGMIVYGGEIGPRFYLDSNRKLSLDGQVYVQGENSVHGAGWKGMPSGFFGKNGGVRGRLGYCVSEAFCVAGDLSAGYGTQNYWKRPYVMDRATGPVFMGGLSIHGHINLGSF